MLKWKDQTKLHYSDWNKKKGRERRNEIGLTKPRMAQGEHDAEIRDALCPQVPDKQTGQGNEGKDRTEDATQKHFCPGGA